VHTSSTYIHTYIHTYIWRKFFYKIRTYCVQETKKQRSTIM
jgi:hypothetical protein